MDRIFKTAWIKPLLFLLGLVSAQVVHGQDLSKKQSLYETKIKAELSKYCYDCHSGDEADADMDLSEYKTAKKILGDRDRWQKILLRIKFGDMPPKDSEALPDAKRDQLVRMLDSLINQVDCDQEVNPGYVTIRRLNRNEFRNTIRDLTGYDYKLAADFPGDDTGHGFDNIGDVLSMPTILMEKYLDAAEQISQKAIVSDTSFLQQRVKISGLDFDHNKKSASPSGEAIVLFTSGTVKKKFQLKSAGEYSLGVEVWGDQAGDEAVKMTVFIDGRKFKDYVVKEEEGEPRRIIFKKRLAKGKHEIGIQFLNDFYDPKAKNKNRRDRNLVVSRVQIRGPAKIDYKQLPESHRKIIYVTPEQLKSQSKAIERVVGRLASRAYRRPATKQEVARLSKLVNLAIDSGDSFEVGIQLALQAVLVSPHFLYKVELPPEEGKVRTISEYEYGVSLAYFLWSSMPDDPLLLAAFKKELRSGENSRGHVLRMLKDKKSQAFIENFALQWLQLRLLDDVNPELTLPDRFNDWLRESMKKETELVFREIIDKDLSVLRILDADFTYVNERLALHYGINGPKTNKFERVSLKGTQRRGVLSHASVLTITSNPTRTSPVKRGKWILENILGTPPPPPSPDVMQIEDQSELSGTLREKMQQHRDNPSCASCHAQMDPLGFALENFDLVGRWREKDGGENIDASGELPSGEKFRGPAELQKLLSSTKRDDFIRCFAEKLLTYALGRGLEYYDRCAIDKIIEDAAKQDYRFSAFVIAVVESKPFQMRKSRK